MSKLPKVFKLGNVLTFIVIAGIIYGIYFSYTNKGDSNITVTLSGSVRKGNIEDTINVIGTSKLINEQKIRFNQLGKVTAIHFKEGDKIKKGQIIAELDKTDLLNSLKQAEINLNNSKIKMSQDLKPAEDKDIIKIENDVQKSQNDLALLEINLSNLKTEKENKLNDLQNQIKAKELDIESKNNQLLLAQNQLDLITKQEGKNVANTDIDNQKTIDSAITDARKYLINANTSLISVDSIFGFSEENKNKAASYDIYLSAKDSLQKVNAKNYYEISRGLLNENNNKLSSFAYSGNKIEDVITFYSNISKLFDNMIQLGKSSSSAVNASMATSAFTQSQIDSGFNSMNSVTSQSQSSFDSVKSTLATLQKLNDPTLQKQQSDSNIAKQKSTVGDLKIALANSTNDLNSLRNNLELTSKNYDSQIQQKQNDIDNQKNGVELNKANLEYIKRGPTNEQIALDKNDIAKQELSLIEAKKNLDKYQIEAPFDCIVRQIDFKVGDNLIADDTKFVYLDNPNLLEITAQLDQIEIAKLKPGQKAVMIFDAFPKQEFEGSVTLINPTPIATSGVTSYEIKLTMDKKDFDIYSGMTASINIVIESKKDVLTLPSTFIQKRRGSSFVQKDNGTASGATTEIVTGLSSNRLTEIVSGLNEGDKVLRSVTIPKSGTGSTTQRSIFSGPGGGGGGGGNNRASGTGNRPD